MKNENKIDIRKILKGMGYNIPDAAVYSHIGIWRNWYQGHHKDFHDYYQFNGKKKIKRRRKSLRMAKKVCEDHANLLLNEKVQLTITPDAAQKVIDTTLEANRFRVEGNKLVEVSFALGTGAFVEHEDGEGGAIIDYVRADMIFPIAWEGENITECAFASRRFIDGKDYIYINVHTFENGSYVIKNRMVLIDENGAVSFNNNKPIELQLQEGEALLPGGIKPEVATGSATARFQIIGPNMINNIDIGSPLGVSVFGNSLDLLEGIDLIYDSYCNEFRLGKKRIVVPLSMLQLVQDGDEQWMAFDDNDTEFYGLKYSGDNPKDEIYEINMELRIEDHDKGLQRFLNLLSDKCGLGNDRYNFDAQGGVKTATEVISEKSDLYQNLKKNELILEVALKNMCQAIAEICGVAITETAVNFDDSIIEDADAKRNRMQSLMVQGKFPLARYLQEYEGYSETDAKAIAAETAQTTGDGITFGDGK